MTARLTLATEKQGSGLLIRLAGELDLATSSTLVAALRHVPRETTDIVIDLRGLKFIDGSGLRVLVCANQRAMTSRHRLQLIAGSDPVQRVFKVTGTEAWLPFSDD